MNRGSGTVGTEALVTPGGFNEAPIHESGKCGGLAQAQGRRTGGFNEAPIHESGKCARHRQREAAPQRCFNEAPIHESGKSVRLTPPTQRGVGLQ